MGIRTVMITGDNPVTAAFIANESGVDDFLAEATPENKMALIKEEQGKGRMVAMTGDGTNDAPALAQADVGVAMNTGTQAAKEAGNMVDLDSNPTKLIEIVEVGKQLLITRGALTTFSIANDVAKYFAILPAMFAFTYAAHPGDHGPLWTINVMKLGTPLSAVTSAIIFNALVIPILIPLSLRGVALPRDRRDRAAAPESADLRPGRHHRAVHRDQADRLVIHNVLGRMTAARRRGEAAPAAGAARGVPIGVASRGMRGRFRILLGAAAGVGKTYRMLQEGRQAASKGVDVVIGYLEPHDRPETAALAEGLDVVPRRTMEHQRGGAAGDGHGGGVRRAPELALIDELAHTNAPGSRHAKRYQDIEEVLDAGIDVISTVNIQHLESLNDTVFELTGVRVRETLPDRLLDEADEVVLVDLTPEELQERMRAGKVYPMSRVETALQNFFTRREPGVAAPAGAARAVRGRRGPARDTM